MAYTNTDIRGGGSGCAMPFGDLIDIRELDGAGQDLYIRMAASELGMDSNDCQFSYIYSAVSSDQKIVGDRTLKLILGSCYLPHPDKEETGGVDAHFICVDEQAIGVADGVRGWADLDVDAGQYARELV